MPYLVYGNTRDKSRWIVLELKLFYFNESKMTDTAINIINKIKQVHRTR